MVADRKQTKARSVSRRDWKLIVGALLALALVIGVIAYKYTDDFTGFAKLEPAENRAATRAT